MFAFLHSSSNSISDYLNDNNEMLHAVNGISFIVSMNHSIIGQSRFGDNS